MRIIVTGGTGFIGRGLCRHLDESGYEVVVLTRDPEKAKGILGDRVRCVGWDGRSADGWVELVDGAKCVVNLAGKNIGAGRWTPDFKERVLKSRVDAGLAIVEAVGMAESKPEVVVQASAVGYYGPRGDEVLDETSSTGADFLSSVCREWEASTALVEDMGVRRAVVRTGVVLAIDGGALPRMLRPFRLFIGGPLGDGRQWFPWIHYEDEIAAIHYLIETEGANGAYNLTAPQPLTMNDFCRVLGRAMGRPSWMRVPGFMLRLLFGEMADALLMAGQRALPERLTHLGFEFKYPTAGEALAALLRRR